MGKQTMGAHEKEKTTLYNKEETKKYDGMAYKLLYILSRK